MLFRNLTPHEVNLLHETSTTYPVCGIAPRVTTTEQIDDPLYDEVNDITIDTVVSALSDAVTDLPDPEPGVILIVSRMTCEAKPHRRDLVYPEGIVRSPDGVPIGCRRFGRAKPTS
jgi:hypothetical protein